MRTLYDQHQLKAALDEHGICRVHLDNPLQLNALNTTMAAGAAELAPIIEASGARVVVFSGSGRAFSAGGDLNYLMHLSQNPAADSAAAMLKFYRSYLSLFTLPLPTIAHINGPCVGAGFCLALACDLRYAVSGAKIGMNFVRIGLNPGMAAEFWASRENHVLLREMLLTGAIYSSSDSRMRPLFNQIGSAEEIAAAVDTAAQAIAANSPQSLAIALDLLRNPLLPREEVMQREAEGQGKCMSTGEIQESVTAQREGRLYRFQR